MRMYVFPKNSENFSMEKLQAFSKDNNCTVIVRNHCKIENGKITFMRAFDGNNDMGNSFTRYTLCGSAYNNLLADKNTKGIE